MPKSTYRDRYTSSGDTIPATRPAGDGSPGTRPAFDTGDAVGQGGNYPAGTKLVGYYEEVHPSQDNRPHWYLWSNTDFLYEQLLGIPTWHQYTAGGGGDAGKTLSSCLVYLGITGATSATLGYVLKMLNQSGGPLYIGADEVLPSNLYTSFGGVSMYPGGGLPAVGSYQTVSSVSTTNLVLTNTLADTAVSVSLINYSSFLRGIRDGNLTTIKTSFSTIVTVNVAQKDFNMHTDVQAASWAAGDEVYITHFAYQPYVDFGATIPASTVYVVRTQDGFPLGLADFSPNIAGREEHGLAATPNRITNLALGKSVDWTYSSDSGAQWSTTTEIGGPGKTLTIPVIVPNKTVISDVQLRYYCDGSLSTDSTMTLYKESWASGRTAVQSYSFDANGVTIEPKLSDTGAFTETVDTDTYEYYLEVTSGFDSTSGRTHAIYGCKVKFTYKDNYILPE